MPAELTTEGLSTQTFAEIRAEIVADLVAIFGPTINTLPSTILGQLVDIWSELESVEQQALLALWRAQDPAAAEGVALEIGGHDDFALEVGEALGTTGIQQRGDFVA